jgi:hypothetical protein
MFILSSTFFPFCDIFPLLLYNFPIFSPNKWHRFYFLPRPPPPPGERGEQPSF